MIDVFADDNVKAAMLPKRRWQSCFVLVSICAVYSPNTPGKTRT